MEVLSAYIPIDRRWALAHAESLPDRASGAVLFADISGFTPLTAALAQELGPQRGAEVLTRQLNRVYGALIAEVLRYGGSVTSFSGDAITCWFDDNRFEFSGLSSQFDPSITQNSKLKTQNSSTLRAVACALDMQRTMDEFVAMSTPAGATISMGIKVAVAAGRCRRFLVGHPRIQAIEVLAGALLDRVAAAEQLAQRGEVVVGAELAEQLGAELAIREWRADGIGQRFAVLGGLERPVPPAPWPDDLPDPGAEIARDWLLPPVYQRLVRGEGEFLAELRSVVVLFLKFVGLDYDQDDRAGEQLDAYIRWAQAALARYEGYLLQVTIGDKGSYFYAAFGAPIAHEDDAARAVAAALALQTPPAELDFIRDIQIGISQGQMRAGAYGAPNCRTYGVMGNEVNVAARLMSLARPGQILATGRVASAARGSYDVDDLGPQRLKGQAEPIPVFAVRGKRQEPSFDSFKGRAPARIVGRAAERAALSEQLAALRDGRGSCLIVEGDAGIGKSRLVGELIAEAAAAGVACLIGSGDAIERSTAYHAWRSVFSQLFQLVAAIDEPDTDNRPAWRTHVLAHLEAIAPELIRLAPLLNVVLPIDLPDNELTAQMSGEVRANNIHDLLVGLLQHRAQIEPLLILLEDAHWFDSASWTLTRLVSAQPLLLVISTRPLAEPLPAGYAQIRGAEHTRRLTLEMLPPEEIDVLVCQRLGVRSLPAPVSNLIRAKAEGHPFFSEELAYALRDAGLIQIEGEVCQLAPGVRELRAFDFPDTIQGVITSRVDRLSPAQQLTLKVASVIGRMFLYSILENIYPVAADKPTLVEHLNALNRLQITQKETIEPDLAYIFKHILAQEAVYSLLLYTQRQQLHHAVASWYEQTYSHDLAPFYSLLSYHWRQAEVLPKAIDYLEKAGEQALRGGAFQEAARFFEAALELVEQNTAAPRPAGSVADQVRQAGWRWKLGVAYLRLGRLTQGRELSEQAMAVFDQPVPATKGRLAIGIARQLALQVLHRLQPGRFIDAAAAGERERLLTVVSIYQTLSQMYYFFKLQGLGVYAALRQANVAEQAGPSLELAQAYAVMCIITGIFGLRQVAEGYYNRALMVARHLSAQPYVLANVLHRGSIYRVGGGQFARVRADLTLAMEIYQYIGDRASWRECLTILTNAEYLSGHFDRTLQLTATSLTALPDDDGTPHQFWVRQWQSSIALRQDRPADALADLEQATQFLGRGLEGLVEVSYHGVLAMAHWRRGERQLAQESAERAAQVIARANGVPLVLSSLDGYVGAAEVFLSIWEAAAQQGLPTKQARAAARRACWHLRVFRWFLPAGRPAAWLYQGWHDWLAGKPARALQAWRTGLDAAEQLGMPYEQGRTHFEIGRHLAIGDPDRQAHLARARDLFTQLGAADYLRRTLEALGHRPHA